MNSRIYFLLIGLCLCQFIQAQEKDSAIVQRNTSSLFDKLKFWEEDSVAKKEGFFVLPLFYYTPDTRFALGAAGVYYFNTANEDKGDNDHYTRLSYIKLLGDYTQNKQIDIWSDWVIFTDEEKWLLKGDLRYRNFPDSYYGIGNNSKKEDVEKYAYDFYSIKFLAMKRIGNYSFTGLDYVFENEYNFTFEGINTPLSNGEVVGARGGIGSAVGAVFLYDSRDNVVNAYEGKYLQFSSYFFRPEIGSTFDFININTAYSSYHELKSKHILAFNFTGQFNFGDVPFLDLAKVGNDDILRGYPRNRFRDDHFMAAQTEYRFPIYKRFGAVAFMGIGDVFSKMSQLQTDYIKYSYGGGLRFSINQKERLNIRLDYGIGRDENAFYLMVTEAF